MENLFEIFMPAGVSLYVSLYTNKKVRKSFRYYVVDISETNSWYNKLRITLAV